MAMKYNQKKTCILKKKKQRERELQEICLKKSELQQITEILYSG